MSFASLLYRLTTIFPCEHSLAIVVDDRDDVWPPDLPNLIKVSPFRYRHFSSQEYSKFNFVVSL